MAELAVLMWNISCMYICSKIVPGLNAFALSGRVNIICCGITQGVASLALGYVQHWAFSPPLLNPKLKKLYNLNLSNFITS